MSNSIQRKTVYAIGECMVELSFVGGDNYRRSFAGDAYNTAVYLKRLAPIGCDVEFVSCVGQDGLSAAMMSAWREEGISTNYTIQLPGRTPGLYVIDTDEVGERSFSYWRSNSAARELTVALARIDDKALGDGDVIYYSGITLAILKQEQRDLFFQFIKKAKASGVTIAFDPNYRPVLWDSHAIAAEMTTKAYAHADIVLTGADDDVALFGRREEEAQMSELERSGVKEAILKSGEGGVFGACEGRRFHVPFSPAQKVVDTTAAGDSFAGAYLAFRLRGKAPEEACALAARVARIIVSSPGAIIERQELFAQMRDDRLLGRELGAAI